jgi:uncharacterized protein (TIGR00290 family)
MPQPKKILVSWSSGKDSAWSLHLLRQQCEWEIAGLLTTINAEFDRVAMHAVRRTLVEKQAAAAGLRLWTVPLPWPCSNEEYERLMAAACRRAVDEGISAVAFGDLFLRDIREYRERQMRETGLQPVFPVWNFPTADLAQEMIGGGLRARLTCVDPRVLSRDFAGREFDDVLLAELPAGIDPCGENGEFHTFVYDGPMFGHPIDVMSGEIVERDGFIFADLMER